MSFAPLDDQYFDQEIYVQCSLNRPTPGVHTKQTTYLPEKFAVLGTTLKLKNAQGVWEDGWRVEQVHTKRIGVPYVQGDIRGHRRATGDSLPKRRLW